MKLTYFSKTVASLGLFLGAPFCSAATVNVTPGVNNVAITQVVYYFEGAEVTQTEQAVGVLVAGDDEVSIRSVSVINGGIVNLEYINTEGATILNTNPELGSINGIGVYDHGTTIDSSAGLTAFNDAVAVTTTDSDLRNYVYYDLLNPAPPTPSVPDFDIVYTRAMNTDDYILVSERYGNTYFEVTPLKADGTPYVGANVLRFGGAGGDPYAVYDWNTGVAAAENYPDQAHALSVASVSKFFEGTDVAPGPVYGFRIDNDGEADTKILVISDNPFSDNPLNPSVVPEPSSFFLSLGSVLFFLTRRNRKSAE